MDKCHKSIENLYVAWYQIPYKEGRKWPWIDTVPWQYGHRGNIDWSWFAHIVFFVVPRISTTVSNNIYDIESKIIYLNNESEQIQSNCGNTNLSLDNVYHTNGLFNKEAVQSEIYRKHCNMRVSRMRAPLSARREPAGIENRPPNELYIFEHKT